MISPTSSVISPTIPHQHSIPKTELTDSAALITTAISRPNNLAHGIVGNSNAIRETIRRVERIAPYYRSVLITGPTGTGKELFAHALRFLSPVAKGNFVVVNCSAVVEALFESELFGHVRGAFTGATADKIGLFEYAHRGTLFLDEIGDMPLTTQAKLLRVLQNQEVLRLGSLTPRKVEVRIIAATNKDLRREVANKAFREDLYYRISMVEVSTPPLAGREDDVKLLSSHFIARFSSLYRKEIVGITNEALFVMQHHSWPGNVRELENAVGHGCMLCEGKYIGIQDLPAYFSQMREASPEPLVISAGSPKQIAVPLTLMEQERKLLEQALTRHRNNQTQAARTLGISRDTLRYRMKKHGLIAEANTMGAVA